MKYSSSHSACTADIHSATCASSGGLLTARSAPCARSPWASASWRRTCWPARWWTTCVPSAATLAVPGKEFIRCSKNTKGYASSRRRSRLSSWIRIQLSTLVTPTRKRKSSLLTKESDNVYILSNLIENFYKILPFLSSTSGKTSFFPMLNVG